MRAALIIGHTTDRPGACSPDGVCEYPFNADLAGRVRRRLPPGAVRIVERSRPNAYGELPAKVNATDCDIAVSMHANAYDTQTSGTEVLHWHRSEAGETLASCLQVEFLEALGLENRGLKPTDYDGRGGYLLGETRMPAVICEPFFIDHPGDWEIAQRRTRELAQAYAEGIRAFAARVGDTLEVHAKDRADG